jgi:hypothetical protein
MDSVSALLPPLHARRVPLGELGQTIESQRPPSELRPPTYAETAPIDPASSSEAELEVALTP